MILPKSKDIAREISLFISEHQDIEKIYFAVG